MTKPEMLKILNPVLALAFVGSAGGGLVRFLAPDAIPYSLFSRVHPLFGCALVLCVVLHIWLNWTWIRSTFFRKKSGK